MAILTPVIKLVVFRQSLRPHSAIAFLVEFLCFVLELLDKEKDLAKIFGIICACDTLIFTFLDIIQNLMEEEVKIQRCGRVFWLYAKDGSLYWHTLNAYLLMLCIVHVISSSVSYVSHRHYLVLLPLFAAGLELVPQEAYRVLGPNQESRDCIGRIQGFQDSVVSDQESRDCIVHIQDSVEPDQESRDYIGPIQNLQDCVGMDLESRDFIAHLPGTVEGNYQDFQVYVELDQDSQNCIGSLQDPLDGIELDQESQNCNGSLQEPLNGTELEQETVVAHVVSVQGPLDGIELDQGVVIQVGPNCSP